jgi:HPt (histidine-containing phosphotransfer) domain-containing protein
MSNISSAPIQPASIDLTEMRRRLGHDVELIRDVARVFLDTLPGLREDVARASDRADSVALGRAVHVLRGALLDVGAFRAAEFADRVDLGGGARGEGLVSLFGMLDEAAAELEAFVARCEPMEETADDAPAARTSTQAPPPSPPHA